MWKPTKEQLQRAKRKSENDPSGKRLRELLERSRKAREAREREGR